MSKRHRWSISIKKHKNIILFLSCFCVFLISIGYSLLNENLNITAKGIISAPVQSLLKEQIIINENINNTGLVSYNNDYYYFKGMNPNNYIVFNNELWRIISIQEDGIRLIKDEFITSELISSTSSVTYLNELASEHPSSALMSKISIITSNGVMLYDPTNRRPINENLIKSYCKRTRNGCNSYASNYLENNENTFYDNQPVDADSVIKLYLENLYLSTLPSINLTEFTITAGLTKGSSKSLDSVLLTESNFTLKGSIALAYVSDYVRASSDESCTTNFQSTSCSNGNWMKKAGNEWYLLTGKYVGNTAQVWIQATTGTLTSRDANNTYYLRPVIVLNNKTIIIDGIGTISHPYEIGNTT